MTFFRFAAPQAGQSYDYPTLGFFAVDGGVLDGTASNPQITAVPDAHWTVVASGPESGITRYRQPQTPPDDQSSWDGSLLVYDATTRAFVRKLPSQALAPGSPLDAAVAPLVPSSSGSATAAALSAAFVGITGSDTNLRNGLWRRRWDAAVGNRENAPARALMVGDSITEGMGATSQGARWQNRLAYALKTARPTTGLTPDTSSLYLPVHWRAGLTTIPAPATQTGGNQTHDGFGLGKRETTLNANGNKVVWTVTGTSIDIAYAKRGGAQPFYYSIDGGAQTTIPTDNGGAAQDGFLQRVSLGASGTHTVEVGTTAGGNGANIEGIFVYNGNESKGLHVIDSGWWGSSESDWIPATGSWQATYFPQIVTTLQPALVVIELGENDWKQGKSSATFKANMQAIITNIGNACTVRPSFLLLGLWQRSDATGLNAEPWANYIQALSDIAKADSGVAFLDMSARMPAVQGDVLGLYYDAVHPNNAGHGTLADGILSALL